MSQSNKVNVIDNSSSDINNTQHDTNILNNPVQNTSLFNDFLNSDAPLVNNGFSNEIFASNTNFNFHNTLDRKSVV